MSKKQTKNTNVLTDSTEREWNKFHKHPSKYFYKLMKAVVKRNIIDELPQHPNDMFDDLVMLQFVNPNDKYAQKFIDLMKKVSKKNESKR